MKINKCLYLLFCPLFLIGQNVNPFICGHEHVLEMNEKAYPGYNAAIQRTFEAAYKNMDDQHSRNDIFTIPVIIHIVWKNNEENLHDSIIQSQMNMLNESFRLQNSNRHAIRDIFKVVQADAGIEFKLHEVKRVKTNASFAVSLSGLPDKVKQTSQGGSDASDPDKFFNIWVCKIQPIPFIGGQLLCYAYPPIGLAGWPAGTTAPSKNLEGVVIDFRVFGGNNPNKLTVNGVTHNALGRTTVHETGHYLGLRHIWGDGGGIFGGNSCNADDGISDTPNQGAQTSGCDTTSNTCIDTLLGPDLPDMMENYMDYSAESCQNTFTKEQVNLMRGVLQNQRSQLVAAQDILIARNNVTIIPNPASQFIHVFPIPEFGEYNMEIRDISAKVVFSRNTLSNNFELDISTFLNGFYLVSIISEHGVQSCKLIISHE